MIYLLEDDSGIRELVAYTLTGQVMQTVGFERPSYRHGMPSRHALTSTCFI